VKGRNYISSKQCGQGIYQARSGGITGLKKQQKIRRLLGRYQKEIDVTLAATSIGVMFLTGIWSFLVQLAAF